MSVEPPDRKCLCGSKAFSRVRVERQYKPHYETEFISCDGCGVMYHAPSRPERWPIPPGRLDPQSPEEMQRLMEAVARANKSKPKR
jgi:hypothetical protein